MGSVSEKESFFFGELLISTAQSSLHLTDEITPKIFFKYL